jgi:hypothetical protein
MNSNSHRKRRNWLALATALAAPVLILALSGAAQAGTTAAAHRASAAVTTPNCPSATLCTYQNADYNNNGASGTQWNFPYNSTPHLQWVWIGSAANDQISSLNNHRAWISYVNKDCPATSQAYAWGGGSAPNNLQNWSWPDGSNMNDSISAIALGTSSTTQGISHGSC